MINPEVKGKMRNGVLTFLRNIKNKSQEDFEITIVDFVVGALHRRDEMKEFLALREAMIDFLFLEEDGALGICGKEESRRLVDKAFVKAIAEADHFLDICAEMGESDETEERNE